MNKLNIQFSYSYFFNKRDEFIYFFVHSYLVAEWDGVVHDEWDQGHDDPEGGQERPVLPDAREGVAPQKGENAPSPPTARTLTSKNKFLIKNVFFLYNCKIQS